MSKDSGGRLGGPGLSRRFVDVEPKSEALGSLHEVVRDLHEVGAIDEAAMRDFDEGCLTKVEVAKAAIGEVVEEKGRTRGRPAKHSDKPWEKEGVSRMTWYRRKRVAMQKLRAAVIRNAIEHGDLDEGVS